MVTQKPISLKIDTELLEELDKEVSCGYHKRNWHINQAIQIYLELLDIRRLCRCVSSDDDHAAVINRWLRERFPEAATW